MMSVETRLWLKRVFGAGLELAADAVRDAGEEGAALLLSKLAPSIVETILEEVINEDVELSVQAGATATGDVTYRE